LRLVKQIKLYFQEGTSDKVYEIDLCESGDGFLVNFRYGRRGAALKDGTKTIFPVELAEAEKVFHALEHEKRKKGYVAAGETAIITSSVPSPTAGTDKRKKAIVKLLKAAAAGDEHESWKLSRMIWRAGDLKIREAIPHIVKVADASDPFNIYSVIWAIARCGSVNHIPFLQDLQKKGGLPVHTQQLITEALLKLTEGKEKEVLLETITTLLPAPLRKHIIDKDYTAVEHQLREYLFVMKAAFNDYLIGIYQLSRHDIVLHEVFIRVLNDIPLSFNYFKYIRQIFKTAEMLEDYAAYGIIAKNVEKQASNYKSSSWMNADHKKKQAFSNRTKAYLTNRVLRSLQNYGEANDSVYVELASEILLAFDDTKDLTAPYQTSEVSYKYNSATRQHTREEKITYFDSYSHFQAFNFILIKNSIRYENKNGSWVRSASYVPATTQAREEAFPHLWNKAAEQVIELLSFSKSLRVHEFALKVFIANPEFEKQIEISHVIHFLQTTFSTTQQLGLELARKKYDRNSPHKQLLIALLDNSLEEARKQAEQWIGDHHHALLEDAEFIASLVKMKRAEAHAWLRGFLAVTSLKKDQAEIAIAKIIAFVVSFEIKTEDDRRYLVQLSDSLVLLFDDHLSAISLDIIKDLFLHASAEVHALAGKILIKHRISPEKIPSGFLQILLQSENASSRGLGIALLGKFPEDALLEKKEMLVSFCLSPLADVRNAVKPIISRLTKVYPEFGKELVDLFVPAFLIKESYEGVHDDLLSLLSHELSDSLHIIPKERSLLLLNSKYRTSQLMGLILLKKNIKDEELTVPELVKLGSNALEEVRLYSWNCFRKYPEKIKSAKDEALKLTDSYWADTRLFAFDYFTNTFTTSEWTTDLLVMLCDSVKEDVQDFGKAMITQFFEAENGTEYLLKLSQHPSTKVQLFTTAYLENYACGKPDIIQQLKPYFITLLSHVNKGKAAKARAFAILRKEALKNEETARIAADIFTRVSVSMAIHEKAECIAALRDIHNTYASISSPVIKKVYADYSKV
jgi:predicted DNA-binding WGR domain protein